MIGAVYTDPVLGTTYTVKQEIEADELGRRFLVHNSDWDATIVMYLDAIQDWEVPATAEEIQRATPPDFYDTLGADPCGHPTDALGHCLGSCQGEEWDR